MVSLNDIQTASELMNKLGQVKTSHTNPCKPYVKIYCNVGTESDNRKIAEWLIKHFGGSADNKCSPKTASTYQWTLKGERAIGFLMTIYPFLSNEPKERYQLSIRKQVYDKLHYWRHHDYKSFHYKTSEHQKEVLKQVDATPEWLKNILPKKKKDGWPS
jgi:hypothetical protein